MSSIPTSSNYPQSFDTDNNLYVAHDSLRLTLAEDYNPGDTLITVNVVAAQDQITMSRFPDTGLITLTDQVSDIDLRAISFYYSAKTTNQFTGVSLLEGFEDNPKYNTITNVTQNVMSDHHDNLKNSLIAIENFIGTQGTIDSAPFGITMEGRTNYLRKVVYTPRAWFSADKTIGLVPLTVTFEDLSTNLGDGSVNWVWDFGDQGCGENPSDVSIISLEVISGIVPPEDQDIIAEESTVGTITKTYTCPGNFDVKLTVTNQYGTDTVDLNSFINARIQAPEEAIISFTPNSDQNSSVGDATPLFSRLATVPAGPYTYPPTIRSEINSFIDMQVPTGNRLDGLYSNAGEPINGSGDVIDEIVSYQWSLGDDLAHSNSNSARASFSVGGLYDIKLRVDTDFGAYRITNYQNCIDVIERQNLWLFTVNNDQVTVTGNEFGLISETFKTATRNFTLNRNDSFLNSSTISDAASLILAQNEFNRNTGFAPIGTTASGERGDLLMFYAGGGSDISNLGSQPIRSTSYNGFSDTYTSTGISLSRPWNWLFLTDGSDAYFAFGPDPAQVPGTNQSFQNMSDISLDGNVVSSAALTSASYINNASELQSFPTNNYDESGNPVTGRFAVYRSCWQGSTGFFIRNSNVGLFYQLSSFYKTEGTISDPIINFNKLPDITGTVKLEGQLVSLSSGIFFFDNSGNISAYNNTTGVWQTGSPNASSPSFLSLQDNSVSGFDSLSNTLLVASDGDASAYLSYDYSTSAFIKYNGTDATFTRLAQRPTGEQFTLGIY